MTDEDMSIGVRRRAYQVYALWDLRTDINQACSF